MADEPAAVVTVTIDHSRTDRQVGLSYTEGTIAIGAGDYYTVGLAMRASAFAMQQPYDVVIEDFVDSNVLYRVVYDNANEAIRIYTIDAPGGAGSCDMVELVNDDPMPATPSSVKFHAIGVPEF